MRKILIIVVFIFVCGCSNTLKCSYSEKYEDIKINNVIEFNFKTGKYKQIDKMIFSDNDSAQEYFEDIKDYVDEYNLTIKNNVITSIIEDDIKLEGTKKEIKTQYESYDYKCR